MCYQCPHSVNFFFVSPSTKVSAMVTCLYPGEIEYILGQLSLRLISVRWAREGVAAYIADRSPQCY